MKNEFINLAPENIHNEHLCCIIRTKTNHPGIENKRQWLAERLKEGHVFRKLNEKATVFIEYAPLETAWVPISGNNYYYIYCLWVLGEYRGKGYGKQLLEYCIEDAKKHGKSGICMLGADKQKAWLSDQSFVKKYDFKVVDKTNSGYELLALSFDGSVPSFNENAKKSTIDHQELTIFYSMQCPYIEQNIQKIRQYCETEKIPVTLNQVDSLQKAKDLPCPFNNWAVFYEGSFKTVNLMDVNAVKKLLKKI